MIEKDRKVAGESAFQFAPIDKEDGLIDQLIERSLRFHDLLRKRLKEKSIPASQAAKMI